YAILQGTLTAGGNYTVTYVGANLTILPAALTQHLLAVGADAGAPSNVKVFNADGTLRFSFFAYGPGFTGGGAAAAGGVHGDRRRQRRRRAPHHHGRGRGGGPRQGLRRPDGGGPPQLLRLRGRLRRRAVRGGGRRQRRRQGRRRRRHRLAVQPRQGLRRRHG